MFDGVQTPKACLPNQTGWRSRSTITRKVPIPVGAGFIAVLLLLVYLAFNVKSLPFIGSGSTYTAAFSEVAGLHKGDRVRIAGIDVRSNRHFVSHPDGGICVFPALTGIFCFLRVISH